MGDVLIWRVSFQEWHCGWFKVDHLLTIMEYQTAGLSTPVSAATLFRYCMLGAFLTRLCGLTVPDALNGIGGA